MLIAGALGMRKQVRKMAQKTKHQFRFKGRKSTKTRRESKQLNNTVQETREKLLKI